MIDRLWMHGSLGYITNRPFYMFVLTAGERLWVEADSVLRPTVDLAWRRAEWGASDEEVIQHTGNLQAVYSRALDANDWQLARLVNVLGLLMEEPASSARTLVFPHPMSNPESPPVPLLSPAELRNSCGLMREFFGSQSGPPPLEPALRTSTVIALTRQMYESRDYSAMPILADALQDAGCDNEDILKHCRGKVPHIRGCWVVDLVLGEK